MTPISLPRDCRRQRLNAYFLRLVFLRSPRNLFLSFLGVNEHVVGVAESFFLGLPRILPNVPSPLIPSHAWPQAVPD
jgi:hypothetical protein